MFNYLKVSPPAERCNKIIDIYINVNEHPVSELAIYQLLFEFSQKGDTLNWEDLDNYLIANSPPPRTEEEKDELLQKLLDKSASQWVELLNFVMSASGQEVSERSYIELVEEIPVPEDEIDCI